MWQMIVTIARHSLHTAAVRARLLQSRRDRNKNCTCSGTDSIVRRSISNSFARWQSCRCVVPSSDYFPAECCQCDFTSV